MFAEMPRTESEVTLPPPVADLPNQPDQLDQPEQPDQRETAETKENNDVRIQRALVAAGVVGAVALGASACGTGTEQAAETPTGSPSASADITSEPSSEATPSPSPTVTAGQMVDAEAALRLNGPSLYAYEMGDGTWMAVDKDAPLPEVVVADLTTRAQAAMDQSKADGPMGLGGAAVDGAMDLAKTARAQTKHHVAVVHWSYMNGADASDIRWAASDGGNTLIPATVSTTKEETLSKLQAQIDASADASNWQIIIVE